MSALSEKPRASTISVLYIMPRAIIIYINRGSSTRCSRLCAYNRASGSNDLFSYTYVMHTVLRKTRKNLDLEHLPKSISRANCAPLYDRRLYRISNSPHRIAPRVGSINLDRVQILQRNLSTYNRKREDDEAKRVFQSVEPDRRTRIMNSYTRPLYYAP